MKKVYIEPSVKAKALETESLMAGFSTHDELGDEGQFSREGQFDEEEENNASYNPYNW